MLVEPEILEGHANPRPRHQPQFSTRTSAEEENRTGLVACSTNTNSPRKRAVTSQTSATAAGPNCAHRRHVIVMVV